MTTNATPDSTYEQSKRNIRLLVLDIAWFGLALPATSQFLAIYAIRLDASAALLGWLAALPAIIALATSSLAQWWRNRYPRLMAALFWPALGFRFVFLFPALVAFLPAAWQPAGLIVAVALPAIPQGMASVLFLVMMRESVENDQITALLGRRAMAFNAAVTISTLAFGFWLGQVAFPINYQIMYVVAFGLSLISFQKMLRVRVLSSDPVYLPDHPPIRPWQSPVFRRVARFTVTTHIAFFSLVPIIPLRLVDEMGADEGFVSIFALSGTLAGAVMAVYTHQIVRQIGSSATIAVGMIGTAVGAAMIALIDTLYLAPLAGVLMGAFWTMSAISQFAYFNANAPAESLTSFMTVYNQVVMLSVFAGPMIGSQLVSSTPLTLTTVLLIGVGLRILSAGAVLVDDWRERR
jgi:MFS family permease